MSTPVAAVIDIPVETGLGVAVRGHAIALFLVDGEVHAIENRCSHMDAALAEGELDGCIIACPLHHWEFDVTTGQCVEPRWLPNARPIHKWPVQVIDGMVHVELPAEDA